MTHDDKNPPADDAITAAAAAAAKDATMIEVLQEEIRMMKGELDRYRDLAARAQADLQNAKARVERESDELRKYASESLVRKILPTLDNFQRAFQHIPEELKNQEWVKGVNAIEADLMKQMSDVGLKRMDSLNKPVDSAAHEPLMVGPGPLDTVIEVLEEGYEYNGKVLRPAKVRVGDGTVS